MVETSDPRLHREPDTHGRSDPSIVLRNVRRGGGPSDRQLCTPGRPLPRCTTRCSPFGVISAAADATRGWLSEPSRRLWPTRGAAAVRKARSGPSKLSSITAPTWPSTSRRAGHATAAAAARLDDDSAGRNHGGGDHCLLRGTGLLGGVRFGHAGPRRYRVHMGARHPPPDEAGQARRGAVRATVMAPTTPCRRSVPDPIAGTEPHAEDHR